MVVALPAGDTDPYVSQFRSGFPFPVVLRFLLRSRKGIRTFLDVGANLGHMTLAAAAMGLKCLAVEPDPASFVLLCQALVANRFSSACAIHAAATDKADVLWLVGESAYGQVREPTSETTGTRVPALPLDTILEHYNFSSPDLIKIDVEGHEPEVIRGLERTLRTSRPLLIIESNTWTLGGVGRARPLLADIEGLGYELNLFLSDGSVTRRPSNLLQPTTVADYLAVPKGHLRKALPKFRALSVDEELEVMSREPLDSIPHLLHVCHAIAAILDREPASATRVEPLKRRILDLEPQTLQSIRSTWDSGFTRWLQ
jgi:FkbM family methyltransferase